ncbi:MAG: hypothetical protein JW984_15425 [Deltaproteobacteria bacterium]|uniref:Uncharacterized protein n=1 Tax=Candidatus Zymogenus saltonus TaxID=2844893 RepID=A0A9D8KJC0_9DELT|nr:hypothetical protein [Candidatus Zymogenus saltonus]
MDSTRELSRRRPLVKGIMILTFLSLCLTICVTPAVSGDFTARKPTDVEMAGITSTIDKVFKGWGNLDLDLYMSAWSVNARQYLKNGVERDYYQILERRRQDFQRYSQVKYYWEILDCDVEANRAYVSCHYKMTFTKYDGGVIREDDEEFYVLEYTPDGFWFIIENYDYLLSR